MISTVKRPAADAYWKAIERRDASKDGQFVYAVKTTGIYCRPSCPSRRAKRENVEFHTTPAEARAAGFRPCKRCTPDGISVDQKNAQKVAEACRLIESAEEPPTLDEIATSIGLSPYHFHRLFKSVTGVTPKAYTIAHRQKRIKSNLKRATTVTEAIHEAGFNSSGRFYASSTEQLGMTPTRFRAGGKDTTMQFAVGECSLGSFVVAASDKGISAILLGDDPDAVLRELQDQFPNAVLIGGNRDFEKMVAKVVSFIEAPGKGLDLPLDVRGTAFQHRVWQALKHIPAGQTATYADVAKMIGSPKSVRAVANACASNALAIAIPCHRVIRQDGSLSGYRWGIERKEELLKKEMKS